MSILGFLRRSTRRDEEIVVVGSGLPALVAALELGRRSRRVSVLGPAGEEASRGLGLVALGPGRPYDVAVGVLGRDEARAVWSAGKENLARLHDFLNHGGRDCGYEARGSFLLAGSREEAESLASSEDLLRDDEFPGEFLDHYMLETHFDLSGFAGAYWAVDGGDLDVGRLTEAAAAAAREAGAVFRTARVRGLEATRSGVVVETDEGVVRASAAVVATDGVASHLWADPSPRLLPATPARLRLTMEEGALLPAAVRTADGRIAWQVTGDTLTVAATGHDEAPAGEGGGPLGLEPFASRLPARSSRSWTEPGDIPSDGLPVVGPLAGSPLAVACGFGPLATSFVFAAARWVADALLTGRDPTPRPLRAGRVPAVGLV